MTKYIKGSNQYKKNRKSRHYFAKFLVLCFGLLCLYAIFSYISPARVKYQRQEVILDNLTAKINNLKGSLISDIKKCESSGISNDFGLITFDPHRTNKKIEEASIGEFQYKKKTVTYYYKTLYNKEITGKEAVLIALDEKKSSELTTDIVFNTNNGLDNWITCSKKINAKQRLEIIKALTE